MSCAFENCSELEQIVLFNVGVDEIITTKDLDCAEIASKLRAKGIDVAEDAFKGCGIHGVKSTEL